MSIIVCRFSLCLSFQFVSTPLCCPSRASILTGRYQHNTRVTNNTVPGNCCGSDWRRRLEPRSVAVHLHSRGYTTFYAGKYLNQVSYESELSSRNGSSRTVAWPANAMNLKLPFHHNARPAVGKGDLDSSQVFSIVQKRRQIWTRNFQYAISFRFDAFNQRFRTNC